MRYTYVIFQDIPYLYRRSFVENCNILQFNIAVLIVFISIWENSYDNKKNLSLNKKLHITLQFISLKI